MARLPRLETKHVWLLAITLAVTGLALTLRLHALGRESLWLDEGYTWERSSLPVPELIQHAIRGHHNPSYFILVHYWLAFGDDEFMLRFPSALAGALAAGACVWLGYVLHGLAAGFVAGIVLALAPLQIQYGQEARMYSLLCFSATTAMVGLVRLVRNPARAAVPILGTARFWKPSLDRAAKPGSAAWTCYALGVIGSLYMHNTTVVFAASAGIALLVGCIGRGRLGLMMLVNFVAVNLIVLVVFGVYLSTEIQQAKALASVTFWAKFPTGRELLNMARELYLMSARLLSPLAFLLAGGFGLGLWQLRRRARVALVMLVLCFGGPGLLLLVSLYKPIFGTRMLLWAAAPCCALIGAGAASLRPVAVPLAFAGAVAVLIWPELAQQYQGIDKEPWRELVATIEARARPDAIAVAASAEEAMMLRYYQQRHTRPIGNFRYLAAQRKLPPEVRAASQVFLLDRKQGARSARSLRELKAHGYISQTREFRTLLLHELLPSK